MGEAGDGVAGRTRPPLVGVCIRQLRSEAHCKVPQAPVSSLAWWHCHPSAIMQGGSATPGVIGRLRLRVYYFL
ncbi:MAG: hypothetical protein IKT27_06710 [Clostridia bacterium]|nr:hypothetical protein [Clostridia bacterium]